MTCTDFIKNDAGEVIELRCTYDPETKGGNAPDGRKVKATMHWVSAEHAIDAEVRLYDHLFKEEMPGASTGNFLDDLNPDSLEVLTNCKLEPALAELQAGSRAVQFERLGYFCADRDSAPGAPVFNRTATLRDAWAKAKAKG